MSFRKEKNTVCLKVMGLYFLKHYSQMECNLCIHLRKISSCYFDTNSLNFFHESEEGVLPRKKVRLRWYNNIPKFTKETKISSIEGRYKSIIYENIKSIKDLFSVRLFDSDYGNLYPTVIVSYDREYYDVDNMRITFDKNISYNRIEFHNHNAVYDVEMVVEVKVPEYCHDDYIQKLIFYPISRFSKYSRGIVMTNKIC